MKHFITALALCATVFAAHAAGASCEAKAVDKNGKPLAGAAKTSFMKKCETEHAAASSCEAKAVDKNGKPLSGAAKTSSIKKCEHDAAASPAAAASK
jgi:Na+-transporting NADH:ubiquinone oxidoreductase subunit NqrC